MDFADDIDLTIVAPEIRDVSRPNRAWDAFVRHGVVAISHEVTSTTIEVAPFEPDDAERLGKRLIVSAAAARALRDRES